MQALAHDDDRRTGVDQIVDGLLKADLVGGALADAVGAQDHRGGGGGGMPGPGTDPARRGRDQPMDDEHLLAEAEKIAIAPGRMFPRLCQVVLNDLRNTAHAIRVIEDNLSGRNVGDSATANREQPLETLRDRTARELRQTVEALAAERAGTPRSLSREDKKALVRQLHRDGYFDSRDAAQTIADLLGVSRATVCNSPSEGKDAPAGPSLGTNDQAVVRGTATGGCGPGDGGSTACGTSPTSGTSPTGPPASAPWCPG
ncbi:hypothetical protein GCM10017771_90310 [Streptomyces capitiformicae]|uniref:Uncharacterized protein n=1 Tax=Streptomyces capitiformicae TaxID=2014920 RepID=A0A918ZSM2_9ACTN|nr:hypothetical protein GCM10017771_90310 [Streptomyces capitiformicae]